MDIEKIRAIRTNPAIKLKPSPFLKDKFKNEYGDEVPVSLRNYQAQGIMNLLQVTRMVLGDDTGLGKTIETLSAIGYIWLVEPEYVPIVVAKKSALYQWADETTKFMKDMEAVVADGEPYERDKTYREFFESRKSGSRKLLIVTYDTVLKDAQESVVRDRDFKPTKETKAALKAARSSSKSAIEALAAEKKTFEDYFKARGLEFVQYLMDVLKPADKDAPPPPSPVGWTVEDQRRLDLALAARNAAKDAELMLARARDAVEPPKVAPGLIHYVSEMLKDSGKKLMMVFDEAHVLKNPASKIHKACFELSCRSERVVGMTATPVKNRLMEFYGVFHVVYPQLFPKITYFHRDFCIVKMQAIGQGRKVPIVVGHRSDQLDAFVKAIEPFYLSRRKHEVAKELPELISREITCYLSPEQEELYDIAELQLEESGESADADPAAVLKSMTMIRQACDAPQLLMDEDGNPYDGESPKVESLIDILQDDPDAKVIVFSSFERMISLIESRMKEEKIPVLRITGKEAKAELRRESAKKFQDANSGFNVMLITSAGSESINLHAAGHIVFIDNPWSWGDYVQLTGRANRIGTKHLSILITHLIARRRSGAKTIDDHIIKTLREKKKLADKTSGEALRGGLDFTEQDEAMEIYEMIRASRSGGAEAREKLKQRLKEGKLKVVRSTSSKKQTSKVMQAAEPTPEARAAYLGIDMSDI